MKFAQKNTTKLCREFVGSGSGRVCHAVAIAAFALASASLAHAGGDVSICDASHLNAALNGGGTVTFSCSGTITLPGPIEISHDTTLNGIGQVINISGGGKVELFLVDPGINFNVSNLTISNSVTVANELSTEGAIYNNQGNLTANNILFFNNVNAGGGAGAIATFSSGDIGATFTPTLIVTNSAFVSNRGGNGAGAIYNTGRGIVTNSTFFNNAGGAILNDGGPGSAPLSVTNCTFSVNGYGLLPGQGGSDITNSYGSTLSIGNTILANPAGATPSCANAGNLDGFQNLTWPATSGCPVSSVFTVGDPKLDAFALDNGGPTPTIQIFPGSAAIGATVCGFTPTDQRGVIRPDPPSFCDTGAYEYSTASSLVSRLLSVLHQFLVNNLVSQDAVQKLQIVINPLADSLNSDLWLGADGNHLNPQLGNQVFSDHKEAVNQFSNLIADQTLLGFIKNLDLADHFLAIASIKDACPVTSVDVAPNGACAKSVAALAAGDASVAAGKFSQAIDDYQSAWRAVQK